MLFMSSFNIDQVKDVILYNTFAVFVDVFVLMLSVLNLKVKLI